MSEQSLANLYSTKANKVHTHVGTDITSVVANATNAVNATNSTNATNASYVPFSGITSKPTTLAGYGITDAQQALGFIPVQQGGGTGQYNNHTVYIGWDNVSKLLLQVDSTNFSNNWPISISGNALTATTATTAATATIANTITSGATVNGGSSWSYLNFTGANQRWDIAINQASGVGAALEFRPGGLETNKITMWPSGVVSAVAYTATSQSNFQGSQNAGIGTATASLGGIMVQGNGTGAAFMCFHRPGSYATYFGLDTDNQLAYGGWSLGAARRLIAFQDGDINRANNIPTSDVGGNIWIA